MKLYYAPGVCSLSPHIVLREAGLDFELVKADIRAHKLEDGSDFNAVNPKGYVPVLELDNGERLTEGPTIVQYIADQAPASQLVPPPGTMARYHQQEWLGFINSELHKVFGPLWKPTTPEEYKEISRNQLATRFDWLVTQLEGKQYLTGDGFTAADAYLFTILSWTRPLKIDMARWPVLTDYMARVAARPKVQEALRAEGLLK
ncbi:MAG: glutathione transferase GstA [Moraxellaceae bacterium]|nr:glutathione transferase GstA [Moraxellaceae bacterium]